MATLQSPGVQVQVIDESFYTPSAPGTVPMIFVASAEDKTTPSGSIAQGTTAANAGKVWLITGQRELTDTFGTPLFYTDASGNAQHGNELNEYGLQAAYSLLGVSSRAYIVRADLDLAQLVPTSSEPVGSPVSGTYWVDTDASLYGIKEWNASTLKFTSKTPIVLNDDSSSVDLVAGAPASAVGQRGDYCIVVTSDNTNKLHYKTAAGTWVAVQSGFDSGKHLQVSPHYSYPSTFNVSTATGSVWVTTTTPSNGANWSVKYYNGASQSWSTVSAPIYSSIEAANYGLDATGGKNIPTGSIIVESNYTHDAATPNADFKLWRRNAIGATSITSEASTTLATTSSFSTFNVRETLANGSWSNSVAISLDGTGAPKVGALVSTGLAASTLSNVISTFDPVTNKLTISHKLGGNIEFTDGINTPLTNAGFSTSATANLYSAPSGDSPFTLVATNWKPLVYEASNSAPFTTPADGSLWYTPVVDEVDIMIHDGTKWVGYRSSSSPYYSGTESQKTDPAGPIVSATEPVAATGQSDGTALVTGDIWIDTSDIENYGKNIYVYNSTITSGSKWVLQDTTDQSTPDGWLFADARWATSGSTLTASSISSLLSSNYVDPDAPDPALYPKGMKLWNTRRSGGNVKKYISGHIDLNANSGTNARYPHGAGESMSSYKADRWVSQYTVAEDGSPRLLRKSQRSQVVNAFKELIDANTAIRDTDTLTFNLIATPGYSEAIQNMIGFNTDRGLTAFVVGDTPFRLSPSGTSLSEYGLNTNNAFDNDDTGAVSYDEYMAMYYPSGYTNDNTGNYIVVPPSHMMLRTITNSDAKSYPWFAPAGTRRGGVDNATSVGYITAEGEFKTVALHQGLRDVLDDVKINPIATLTGVGVLAYGQRTRARNASALDRINVSRLVCYLRRQLDIMARPFLFEPNDAQTRREIKAAAESLLLELVGQRALYDFIVVCDETNNTPARIDRSELYLDIAIEPVKAVEFIYIPLRLKNTGDIAAGL
jgi:hypothetical protein